MASIKALPATAVLSNQFAKRGNSTHHILRDLSERRRRKKRRKMCNTLKVSAKKTTDVELPLIGSTKVKLLRH